MFKPDVDISSDNQCFNPDYDAWVTKIPEEPLEDDELDDFLIPTDDELKNATIGEDIAYQEGIFCNYRMLPASRYRECIDSEGFKEYKRRVNLVEEYKYEYGLHYQWSFTWDTFEDFKESVENGKIKKLSEFEIEPFTFDFDSLTTVLDVVSHYASYPDFRNWDVLRSIKNDFESNEPLSRPIAVRCEGERPKIMSGNTRTGIAKMCDIDPEILVIEHQGCYE